MKTHHPIQSLQQHIAYNFILTLLTIMPFSAFAANLHFETFPDQTLPDVLDYRVTKEQLYQQLETKTLKLGNSQCFNRAHVWNMDMKLNHRLETGKLFMFYTGKTGRVGRTDWWFHVAPLINEGGIEYVIDGGFPGDINGPLTVDQWVHNFTNTTNCKVIHPDDRQIFEWMFTNHQFPDQYQGKQYDCYLAKTPSAYWGPAAVASAALGQNEAGKTGNYRKTILDRKEVYSACIEASTTKLGGWLGTGKAKCKRFADEQSKN
jgi:hypothetical protein